MKDLIPPHGGLTEPANRTVPAAEAANFRAAAAGLPRVLVSDADLSTLYRFGDGGLSPLTGPMDRETFRRVLEEEVIIRGGKAYAWTIPLAFPVDRTQAGGIQPGNTVALVNGQNEIVGTLAVRDAFPFDKMAYIKSVYGTGRTDHPGGRMVLSDPRDVLLGGDVRVLPAPMPCMRARSWRFTGRRLGPRNLERMPRSRLTAPWSLRRGRRLRKRVASA